MRLKNLENKYVKKQGFALVSVIAITAIALIVVTVVLVLAVVNSRMIINLYQSEKSYLNSENIAYDNVLKYLRYRDFNNQFSSWTDDCLQYFGTQCKMELSLDENGGDIDVWGRVKGKIRHLHFELDTFVDESVSVSARKEIY
ncbi:hypothetical protein ACFLZ1_03955 [Patescibacteria group bacterium]